jgi:hypothetical protein
MISEDGNCPECGHPITEYASHGAANDKKRTGHCSPEHGPAGAKTWYQRNNHFWHDGPRW